MNTDFEIQFRGDYLHIQLAPDYEITPEGMKKLWSELFDACNKYDCRKVLNEGKIYLRHMRASDAFTSGTQAALIPKLRIAFLFYNYVTDDISEFFKTVAMNRGISIEFFGVKEDAMRWLGLNSIEYRAM